MSSYLRTTKHPETGIWQDAMWLDDYFGPRRYGVKFPHDAKVHDPEITPLETRE